MTKKKPGAKRGRPSRDYSDDPDLEVVEWAVALQAAWGLSERKAFDLALATCQGEPSGASKIPRGAKAGLLLGYKLPMAKGFKSRSADIRLKYKAGTLRPDVQFVLKIARSLLRIPTIRSRETEAPH